MKKSMVELLATINGYKQSGKSLNEIIAIMETMGLHRDDTAELYAVLK